MCIFLTEYRKRVSFVYCFWIKLLRTKLGEVLMREVTREKIEKDLTWLKLTAKKFIRRKKLEMALNTIRIAADLLYRTNIVYYDNELEAMIKEISEARFKTKVKFNRERKSQNRKKVVFYDFFSIDNRGLTEQYLNGLIQTKYEILYLAYKWNATKRSTNIFEKISRYHKAKVYLIDNDELLGRASDLRNQIMSFNPTICLIHTSPADVSGALAFYSLRGMYRRYLINITDHAFWLGKCSADKFIEFRSYGFQISKKIRKINEQNLMILPYYPIQTSFPFQGFPFDYNGKKVIFSGGALNKIYGDRFFFSIIEHIISKHDDTVFLYVGNGDSSRFKNFIAKNALGNRVYYFKERKDICEIFKRIWIYIDTFPLSGGLMMQLAVANKKVPVSYKSSEQSSNIEGVFVRKPNFSITFTDKSEFFKEIDKLITEPLYMKSHEEELNGLIIDRTEFNKQLDNLLQNGRTTFEPIDCEINPTEFFEQSLKLLKNDPFQYYMIFARSHNLRACVYAECQKPGVIFRKIIRKICQKRKG